MCAQFTTFLVHVQGGIWVRISPHTSIHQGGHSATNPLDPNSMGKAEHPPGMVPPQTQRVAFWPLLEQNVQQQNTPWCSWNLCFTIRVKGEPCRGQANREAAAVCAVRCVCILRHHMSDPVSHRTLSPTLNCYVVEVILGQI